MPEIITILLSLGESSENITVQENAGRGYSVDIMQDNDNKVTLNFPSIAALKGFTHRLKICTDEIDEAAKDKQGEDKINPKVHGYNPETDRCETCKWCEKKGKKYYRNNGTDEPFTPCYDKDDWCIYYVPKLKGKRKEIKG